MEEGFGEEIEKIKSGTADLIPEEELEEKLGNRHGRGEAVKGKAWRGPLFVRTHTWTCSCSPEVAPAQDLGHKAVMVVGDFTRRIGDPVGKV